MFKKLGPQSTIFERNIGLVNHFPLSYILKMKIDEDPRETGFPLESFILLRMCA